MEPRENTTVEQYHLFKQVLFWAGAAFALAIIFLPVVFVALIGLIMGAAVIFQTVLDGIKRGLRSINVAIFKKFR
jgi:lipopolysaccharide/colanic/teichoic acid biosynthesis glycosyltransferase